MRYISYDQNKPDLPMYITQGKPTDIPDKSVLIKVFASGINRADTLQKQGKYPPPAGESHILGLEVAGEIIAVGTQVSKQLVGKRICGIVSGGGYAEYALINSEHVIPLADNISYIVGAGLAETYLTAYQTLCHIGQLSADHTVLIHAGASGVGTAAIQIAKSIGAKVLITAGTDEKCDFCLELGADIAINYRNQCFAEFIKSNKITVDLILDPVAGENLNKNVKCLNLDGMIVIIAMLGGRYTPEFDMARLILKRGRIIASTLRNQSDTYKGELVKNFKSQFANNLGREIKPVIDQVFSPNDINHAHEVLKNNLNKGKLVIDWLT